MRRTALASLVAAVLLVSGWLATAPIALAQTPVVRTVLYWSSTCPACAQVKAEALPPIQQRYGDRLEIRLLEVSEPANSEAFLATLRQMQVPQDQWVVPFMVIGDRYLAGGSAIAAGLAAEIERGLAAGGVGWPGAAPAASATPAPLATATANPRDKQCQTCEEEMERWAAAEASQTPAAPVIPTPSPIVADGPASAAPCDCPEYQRWISSTTRGLTAEPLPPPAATEPANPAILGLELKGDPGPAMLAAGLFAVMALSLAGVLAAVIRWIHWPLSARRPGWLIPAAALVGLGAAGYLSYSELTRTQLQCGFLSECDIVQASVYARIGGVPVAVFGVLGYLGVLAGWLAARYGPERRRPLAAWAVLAMALAGTAYSAYLTFLEPFVIGGVCPWCLTSAAAMTVVMLLAARAALETTKTAGRSREQSGGDDR